MLNSLWPKVQPDAQAQTLLNVVAKRLALAGFLVLAVLAITALGSLIDYSGFVKHAFQGAIQLDYYLTHSYSYVFLSTAMLILSCIVHFRNTALLLSLSKSVSLSSEEYKKVLTLSGASNKAGFLHTVFVGGLLVFKIIMFLVADVQGIKYEVFALLFTVLFIAVALLVPHSPLLTLIFLPSDELEKKLMDDIREWGDSYFNAYAPLHWSQDSAGLLTTPQALAYLTALRTGNLQDYLSFCKLEPVKRSNVSTGSTPTKAFQH